MKKSFSKFLFEKRKMQHSPPEQRKQYENKPEKVADKQEQPKKEEKMSIQRLRNTIRGHKGFFTRIVNQLKMLEDERRQESDVYDDMSQYIKRLRLIIDTIETVQMKLFECEDFDGGEDDLQDLYEEVAFWKRHLHKVYPDGGNRPNSRQSSGSGSSHTSSHRPKISLSELNYDVRKDIKKFSGDQAEYLTFKLNWTAIDKKLTSLGKSDAEKLIDLKKVVEGEAADLLRSYQDRNENYASVLKLMDRIYSDSCQYATNALTALIDGNKFANTPAGIKEAYLTMDRAYQALKGMDLSDQDRAELMFMVIAERRLPTGVRDKWEDVKQDTMDPDKPLGFTATTEHLMNLTLKLYQKKQATHGQEEKRQGDGKPLKGNGPSKQPSLSGAFGVQVRKAQKECSMCKKEHFTLKCPQFVKLSVEDKRNKLRKEKRCWLCCDRHRTDSCPFRDKWKCKTCEGNHHTVLHLDYGAGKKSVGATQGNHTKKEPKGKPSEEEGEQKAVNQMTQNGPVTAILRSLKAYAIASDGAKKMVRVFFDGGSECNLIRREVAETLGLHGKSVSLKMTVAGGMETKPTQESRVKFKLASLNGDYISPEFEATTIKKVTSELREVPISTKQFSHLKDVTFTEEFPRQEAIVDIMIGEPIYSFLLEDKTIKGKLGEPTAVKTKLGYMLGGSFPDKFKSDSSQISYASYKCAIKNDFQMEHFWKTEHIGIMPKEKDDYTVDEEEAVKQMRKTMKYNADNKEWSTELLWKKENETFEDNYYRAVAVMKSVERSAIKQGRIDQINKAYKDLLDNGFAEKVPNEEIKPKDGKQIYYLQAHPIWREHETTPCRIVMNAGAKDKDGVSLNDRLLQGPCMLPDIASMLLKFRNRKEIVIMDISKMFLRIKLNRDRDCQRFVWRDADPNKPVSVFRMKTLIFGGVSSPFQAGFTLQEHAKIFEEEYPNASKAVHEDTYMDDVITGSNDVEELKKTADELVSLLKLASMMPHKIMSSNQNILKEMEKSMIAPPGPRKVLGLVWDPVEDSCKIQQSESKPNTSQHETKRTLLQQIAQIFDPLGICTPFTLKAKLFFQDICRQKVDWDDKLDEKTAESWERWKAESTFLKELKQPRCLFQKDKTVAHQYLVGFGDASEYAYGSCVYLVTKYTDNTQDSNLLMAKSRVAPLNEKEKLTIVRLELLAMVTTARLLQFVQESLKLPIEGAFSDSQINLARLKNGYKPYKSWVGNRIKEVLSLVELSKWKFCPGNQNPADLVSRGMDISELINSTLWWKGPMEILSDPLKNRNVQVLEKLNDPELKKQKVGLETYKVHSSKLDENLLNGLINRFEKWPKTVRFFAYILRLCYKEHKEFRSKSLSVVELKKVELFLMKKAQQTSFAEDYEKLSNGEALKKGSKLLNFNPMWDDHKKMIIAETRLIFSNLPNESKRPIILPADNDIVKKYVLNLHELYGHAGPNYTFAMVRQKFLICHGKRQIRKIIKECKTKRCTKPKQLGQKMAPLPESRIDNPEPFKNVAVDLFGPMFVKHKCDIQDCPHDRETKVYGCLFTCFQTRAIHLELMKDGTTEEFLRAFRMMVARRGMPNMVYSDQAKNFVKASKELRKLYQTISWKKIGHEHASKGINWTFNVPLMPHANGLCERMVQSVKQPLRIILGQNTLTFDQLNCILSEVEMIVNNRPLDIVNQEDMSPITPAELMYGKRLDNLTDPNFKRQEGSKVDFTSMWRSRQVTLNSFWKKWSKTYLLNLQIRQKWKEPSEENLLNKIVLLREDNMNRNEWKIAKIQEVYLSKDGLVRSVGLKTPTGFLRRPIHRLALLESAY